MMKLQTWRPGLAGLIYLPASGTTAGEKDRPYYIAEVDQEGKCKVREGPMIWQEAYEKIKQLATREKRNAFSVPIEKRLQIFRSQGYLHFNPQERATLQEHERLKVLISDVPNTFSEKSSDSPDVNRECAFGSGLQYCKLRSRTPGV